MTAPRNSSGSYQASGGSIGRDIRLAVGALAIFGDGFLLYKEHVSATPPAGYTTPDIIMHIVILVLGVFLMDPKRTLELVGQVKDRIPLIGGGK